MRTLCLLALTFTFIGAIRAQYPAPRIDEEIVRLPQLYLPVVTRKHDQRQGQIGFTANGNSLTLYDKEGRLVAVCVLQPVTGRLTQCKVEPGRTTNDVMNAWLEAYKDLAARLL